MLRILLAFATVSSFALLAAETATAQSSSRDYNPYRSRGGGGGFGSSELAQIRRRAVGTGYSSSQLNNITLNQSRIRAPRTGVNSVDTTSGFNSSFRANPSGALRPSAQRPFSNIAPRSTVSPYLRLFDDDQNFSPFAGSDTFQTVIRPQRQQRQFNEQMAAQQQAINARLQEIAAQPAFNPRGSQTLAPTGAVGATYRFYSHYYQGVR